MKNLDEQVRLNPEPTAAQWIRYRRHCAKGTTPGNPKWYRSAVIANRPAFIPHLPPKYPHIETGAQHKLKFGDCVGDPLPWAKLAILQDNGPAYIKAYHDALGLKA